MSRSKRPRRVAGGPVSAHQVREILRDLARWAVASSVGVAGGCSSVHELHDMSHGVPEAGGSAGTGFPVVQPGGRGMPTAGTVAMPPIEKPVPPVAGTIAPPPVDKPLPPMPAQWVPLACSMPSPFDSVKFTRPVDYLAINRSYPPGIGQGGEYAAGASPVITLGQPCETASMPAGCEAALTSLVTPNAGCKDEASCTSFFLTSAGDEVTRSDARSALIALLGSIDTGEKAILVAAFDEAFDQFAIIGCFAGGPLAFGVETRATDGGFQVRNTWDNCGMGVYTSTVHVGKDGTLMPGMKTKVRDSSCSVGRRPAGLQPSACRHARTELGAFLADAARLEAASVFAFERLARELAALGAPEALIADAARSALDEIRHAKLVAALALRFGGAPAAVNLTPLPERSLFAIARENAVEGCVRETFGALLAEHQAQTAHDPEVRAVMAQVAADELRHALLAWRVAEFLEARLSPEERAQLAIARAAAIVQLLGNETELSQPERAAIGWPEPALETEMARRFAEALVTSTPA